jgi:hypothetical protein
VVWDVDTQSEVVTLKGHKYGFVKAVGFADENTLVSFARFDVVVRRAAPFSLTEAAAGPKQK